MKTPLKSSRGGASNLAQSGRSQAAKYTVLTAQKSSGLQEASSRLIRDSLGGPSIPRMAARKIQPGDDPPTGRFYIKNGILRRVDSDSESSSR